MSLAYTDDEIKAIAAGCLSWATRYLKTPLPDVLFPHPRGGREYDYLLRVNGERLDGYGAVGGPLWVSAAEGAWVCGWLKRTCKDIRRWIKEEFDPVAEWWFPIFARLEVAAVASYRKKVEGGPAVTVPDGVSPTIKPRVKSRRVEESNEPWTANHVEEFALI